MEIQRFLVYNIIHNLLKEKVDNIFMNKQPTFKELIKIVLDRILTNEVAINVVNIIFTIFLSIYMLFYGKVTPIKWWIFLVLVIAIHISYIIFSCKCSKKKNETNKNQILIEKFYEEVRNINQKIASGIHELHNFIDNIEEYNNPINAHIFDNKVDIYTISSYVCESVQKVITEVFGKDSECQVTIFKQNTTERKIQMIAYSNNENRKPNTFTNIYKLNSKSRKYHIKIFRSNKEVPYCLCNKEEIKNSFNYNEQSKEREEKICQYIGLPLKTDLGHIELLLQVDVSKEKILGSTVNEMKDFANDLLYPFMSVLHITLERDRIFKKYYTTIESRLSQH